MKVPIIMLSWFLHHSYGKAVHELSEKLSSSNQSAIVGGQPASIRTFPFMAHVRVTFSGGSRYCSGTILSTKFLLTSAHCIFKPMYIFINVGSTTIYGGTLYRSKNHTPHPQYEIGKAENDIGVIETTQEIEIDITSAKVVTLVDQDHKIKTGARVTVPGWGKIKDGAVEITSYSLKSVSALVVDSDLCQSAYRGKWVITDKLFCAGNPQFDGMGPCDGDSGSPAIDSDGKQVGIVAAGVGCGRAAFPEIYTNVGSLRNWIRSVAGV